MSGDLLATPARRRALLGLLYVSEGAPIGYLWTLLPTRLRAEGLPVEDVAALAALITLPWTFKFVWAPLVDVLRSARFGLRPWIVGAQLAMGLTLLPMTVLDPVEQYRLVVVVLLVHALSAATQDVAIDALAVKHLRPEERGTATGWMQAGMVLGRAGFGGVAIALEPRVGAATVVVALVATIWVSSLLVLRARDAATDVPSPGHPARRFAEALFRVLSRPATWLGLAFAALAGAAMESTGALAGPLLVDRGVSRDTIGFFFALPAIVAMAGGVLLGGRLSDRAGRTRMAALALVVLAVWTGVVALAAGSGSADAHAFLLAALTVGYVLFGVLTAATYALLMDITEPSLGATQFSTYMGAVNLCYVWSAWASGRIAGEAGYPIALVAMAFASLLALPLLRPIGRRLRASVAHL